MLAQLVAKISFLNVLRLAVRLFNMLFFDRFASFLFGRIAGVFKRLYRNSRIFVRKPRYHLERLLSPTARIKHKAGALFKNEDQIDLAIRAVFDLPRKYQNRLRKL